MVAQRCRGAGRRGCVLLELQDDGGGELSFGVAGVGGGAASNMLGVSSGGLEASTVASPLTALPSTSFWMNAGSLSRADSCGARPRVPRGAHTVEFTQLALPAPREGGARSQNTVKAPEPAAGVRHADGIFLQSRHPK